MKTISIKFCLALVLGLVITINAQKSLKSDLVGDVENVVGLAGNILTKTGGKIVQTSKNTLDFAGKVIEKAFKIASLPIDKDSKRVKRRTLETKTQQITIKENKEIFEDPAEKYSKMNDKYVDKYMKAYTSPVSKRNAKKNETSAENIEKLFQSVIDVYGDDIVKLANDFLKKINSTDSSNVKRDVNGTFAEKNLKMNDKFADKYTDLYVAIKRSTEFSEKELEQIKAKSDDITKKLEADFKKYAEELKTLSGLFKNNEKKMEKRDLVSEPKKKVEKFETPGDKALSINEKFTDKNLELNDKLSEKYAGAYGAGAKTENSTETVTAADKYLKLNDKYTDKFMKAYGVAKRGIYNEKTMKYDLSKEEKVELEELSEKLENIFEKYSEELKDMSKEFVDKAKDLGKEYLKKYASVVADFTKDAAEKIQ